MSEIREPGSDEPENKERATFIWGEGKPAQENHSEDYSCVNSDCDIFRSTNVTRNENNVVGVKKAPYAGGERGDAEYICINDLLS